MNFKSFKKPFLELLSFQCFPKIRKNNEKHNHFWVHFIEFRVSFSRLFFSLIIAFFHPQIFHSQQMSKLFAQSFLYILNGNLRIYSDLMFAEHSTLPLCIFIMESIGWFFNFLQTHNRFHTNSQSKEKYLDGKGKTLKKQ